MKKGKTITLVSCVSKKRTSPAKAKDLNMSDWFLKASAYASHISDDWYILSAKYGLLHRDQVISPYNETLNKMPAAARRKWAKQVISELSQILKPGDHVIILAGKRYREHIIDPIRKIGSTVQIPMEGLRIGEQLSWLKKRNKGK